MSPPDCVGKSEVTVKCVNGYTLSYNGEEHDFDMFRCSALPKAKLTAANASCNGIVNGVFNVGFYTKEPLNLYKVCFDTKIKRTLYSWTYLNLPSFDGIQWSTTLPKFVKTENFKSFNMVDVYNHKVSVRRLREWFVAFTRRNVLGEVIMKSCRRSCRARLNLDILFENRFTVTRCKLRRLQNI